MAKRVSRSQNSNFTRFLKYLTHQKWYLATSNIVNRVVIEKSHHVSAGVIGISQPFQLTLWFAIAWAKVTWHVTRHSFSENYVDWCTHQVWLKNSARKELGNLFFWRLWWFIIFSATFSPVLSPPGWGRRHVEFSMRVHVSVYPQRSFNTTKVCVIVHYQNLSKFQKKNTEHGLLQLCQCRYFFFYPTKLVTLLLFPVKKKSRKRLCSK